MAGKPKPRETLECTAAQLCEIMGLSMPRVSQMAKEGLVVRAKNGKYDAIESLKNYIAKMKLQKKDVVKTEGVADIETSKARKEEAMAGLAELKLAEARMEVVRISEVDERDAKIGSAVRAATMKRRSELPPLLEGLSASQIVGILDDHDRAMLEKLSDMQSEYWVRLDKIKAAMSNE